MGQPSRKSRADIYYIHTSLDLGRESERWEGGAARTHKPGKLREEVRDRVYDL